MSQKRSRVPAYRLHKPSGQARVIIDGQHIHLGRYGSPESREKYARLIAERAVSPGQNGRVCGLQWRNKAVYNDFEAFSRAP